MESPIYYYDLNISSEFIHLLQSESIDAKGKHLFKKKSKSYYMVTYDKSFLQQSLYSSVGIFRSVIINRANRVVCFSPPKSIDTEHFMKMYPEIDEMIVEEFVEGTMINVFWDANVGATGTWQIATKNVVGAETIFYKDQKTNHTFSSMFFEAAQQCNLNIEHLDRRLCYSFVLQHPKNRIVVPFQYPKLYLVQVYEISHTKKSISHSMLLDSEKKQQPGEQEQYEIKVYPLDMAILSQMECWKTTRILFPKRYTEYNDYTSVINTFASMNTPYYVLGIVIKNKINGERCKIRNPNYEQVRLLRGNQPKLQYLYLSLRKEGKLKEYLQFYPENKNDFSTFRDHLHLYTETLHQNYINCYVKKEKLVDEYPEEYKKHMKMLHKKWLNELREQKQAVTKRVVIDYIHTLHPSQLMYSINYNLVRRRVDFLKADADADNMDVVL